MDSKSKIRIVGEMNSMESIKVGENCSIPSNVHYVGVVLNVPSLLIKYPSKNSRTNSLMRIYGNRECFMKGPLKNHRKRWETPKLNKVLLNHNHIAMLH